MSRKVIPSRYKLSVQCILYPLSNQNLFATSGSRRFVGLISDLSIVSAVIISELNYRAKMKICSHKS